MGKKTSDLPNPEDMAPMFEDAAYWNRYNQTTPWGNVEWNDDRTAMTQTLSPEMQQLMGMQMSMYGGALGEMMNWFGMDPNAMSSFGSGGLEDPFGGLGGDGDDDYLDDDDYQDDNNWELDDDNWTSGDADLDQVLALSSTNMGTDDWQSAFGHWGIPQGDGNWEGGVPDWFADTRHGDDPAAYAAWHAMQNMGVDSSVFFADGDQPQDWTSGDFRDDWKRGLTAALVGPRRPGGRATPLDDGSIEGPDTTGPGDGYDPWGTGQTGGPAGGWGGRQPEMFYSEDIPQLLSTLDWDAIPDLPTLDQFGEDRERITSAMYEQGLGLLDPYLQKMDAQSRQSLADRGIPIGAEIGMAERGDFNRTRGKSLSDLSFSSLMGGYDEAARQFELGLGAYGTGLQGELARIGASNTARGQAWNERMGVRTQKYNELANLLGMSMMPSQQMGYNFNPNIDTMSGYGMGLQSDQFNAGIMNDWANNIFGAISFM